MIGGQRLLTSGLMVVVMLVLLSGPAFSQNYAFGPNVRVNDDPPGQNQHSMLGNSQRKLAARGETAYVVWSDDRAAGGNFHVYFARSTDGGRSFEPNIQVDTSEGAEAEEPALALDAVGGVHVIWSAGSRVLYSKSTDGGRSFTPPVEVSDTTHLRMSGEPGLATSADGQRIYVAGVAALGSPVWITIVFSYSTDGGQTFLKPAVTLYTDSITQARLPSIAVFRDTVVCVAWDGMSFDSLYFTRSVNGGASFDTARSLGTPNFESCMAFDTLGRLYVVTSRPYLRTSDNLGDTFSAARYIGSDVGGTEPSLWVLPDGRIFVAYDFYNGLDGRYDEVRMIFSTDRGETFQPSVNPSDGPDADDEWGSSVAANLEGTVFVAWEDTRNDTAGFLNDVYFAAGALSAIAEAPGHARHVPAALTAPTVARGNIRLEYTVLKTGSIEISVCDENGRRVRTLIEHAVPSGRHEVVWDGRDVSGREVGTGVYFVRLKTAEGALCRKVMLIRD